MSTATVTNLNRKAIVALLVELGFPTVAKLNDERLLHRLDNVLKNLNDDDQQPETDEGKKLLAEIIVVHRDGGEFTFERKSEAPGETKSETKKRLEGESGKPPVESKAAKKSLAKSNGKKPSANGNGKHVPVKLDKFGSKYGTTYVDFNRLLTKKPKTMKEMVQEGNLTDTFYTHVNHLIARGLVVKTPEGYKLA